VRRFDGKIDDDAWLAVEPYSTFTQTDPIEGAPATERTEVRILFDKATVYIGVIGFDSEPDKIIVNQSRRDADLTETDAIIFVFDTFNDNQNAFVFGTNPLGIEYDGQASGEGQTSGTSANLQSGTGGSQRGGIGSFNASWDGDWRVKASITERGWEAEIAIPLKTLRYATGSHGHRRARREVGNPAESHRGFHGQHRFRAGGSRRGTGQPDAVRPLLP